MGPLLYPGNRCEVTEGTPPTLDCVRITSNAFTVTITNATRAYWVQSADPTTQYEIALTDGAATYTVTIFSGAIYTVCAEGGICGTCSGGTVCCSFECDITAGLCDPTCCDILYPPGAETFCQSVLAPDGEIYDVCVYLNVVQPGYYQNGECESVITEITPSLCGCYDSELGIGLRVQFIVFEVTGTGTGTFDPYIPPDDEYPACDEADCPDFNGTYIVPCEGTAGPYGGLDLLCTVDIGGTNYDWYIYKWWMMKDGVLYLRMGIISRISGSGDPAPTPGDGFTEADWIGDDVDFQQRLDERTYEWSQTPIDVTDTCTGTEFAYNSCTDLDVTTTSILDSNLCDDPTVTITSLIYS